MTVRHVYVYLFQDPPSKEESKSGESTPDALDAPTENKKTVSPARPKPPPGFVLVMSILMGFEPHRVLTISEISPKSLLKAQNTRIIYLKHSSLVLSDFEFRSC